MIEVKKEGILLHKTTFVRAIGYDNIEAYLQRWCIFQCVARII